MKLMARRRPLYVALLILVVSLLTAAPLATFRRPDPASAPVAASLVASSPSTDPALVPDTTAPSSANYAFSTSTNGVFTDMSTGATSLLSPNADDAASPLQALPFDFFLMGRRFSHFSVTSNGMIGLADTPLSSSTYNLLSASPSAPIVTAFGGDLSTGSAGSVRYKVTGAAPDRVLTIEFTNMSLLKVAAPGSNDGTYQVRLHETSGLLDFVYGPMMRNSGTQALNGQQVSIGWAAGTSSNTLVSITSTTNLASTTAPFGQGLYSPGPIANLDSAVDGARRTYSFLPTVPAAPSDLTFSAVTPTGMDLNWTPSPDAVAYALYSSTDGLNYTYFGAAPSGATTYSAAGLAPATLYHWQLYALSEGALSPTPALGSQATPPPGEIVSTPAGGPWSAPSTWAGGLLPTANDHVTIADASTVTIDPLATATAYSLTVGQGQSGLLLFNTTTTRTLNIVQSLTVAPGATLSTGPSGSITSHLITIGQDLTNNGTIDLSTPSTNSAGAGLLFTGSAPATLTNNGTLDLRNSAGGNGGLHLNKGSGPSAVLQLVQNSATNVTTQGAATTGYLTIANGTFHLTGSGLYNNPTFNTAAYTIASTAAFWLDSPTAVVPGLNGSPTTAGLLRITAGTYNVGLSSGNSMGAAAGAQIIVEGGTANFASRLLTTNPATYTQSAGTVNLNTVANGSSLSPSFGLTNPASVFNMSGGTIVLVQPSTGGTPLDYSVLGTLNYTGGTLQVGSAATSAGFDFKLRGQIPALLIDNTAHPKTVLLTAQAAILGDLTLAPGTSLNLGGFLCSLQGTTITNQGTIINTTSPGRLSFAGSAPQLYTGPGTLAPTSLNIELDNPSGLTIDPSTPPLTVLRLNLFRGTLTNAGKITLGSGGSSSATIQIGAAGSASPGGSLDTSPTFNPGSGGVALLYAQESTPRTTAFELPPSRLLRTLTISNTNGITLSGGSLTVDGSLTLAAGNLATGPASLVMGPTATVSRTGGHVIGTLSKTFTTPGLKAFEVGTANGYSPVTVNATSGTFPAPFAVFATQGAMPALFDPTRSLTRFWTLSASGVTADLSFTYLDPTDIPVTATESSFVIFKFDGTLTMPGGTVNTVANQATISGVSSFSDWSLAEPQAAYSPTPTPTFLPTDTPTLVPTDTPSPTATSTVTPSDTPTSTPSETSTPTHTESPTSTPTFTASSTPTPLPTDTPTYTATNTPTSTFTASPTATSTDTSTPSPTMTFTASPTNSSTPTATSTDIATDTPTSSPTTTPSLTSTPTDTLTSTPTDTATNSSTSTATPTDTPTDTFTPTATSTITPSQTPTLTQTSTKTPTASSTPTPANTSSSTATLTSVPTNTATGTPTYSPTSSPTSTNTASHTSTATPTETATVTATLPPFTGTPTSTRTDTPVISSTPVPSETSTPVPSATIELTATPTDLPSGTPMSTSTASPSATPTACDMPFVDVAPSEWFFAYVQNLYCDSVISGYSTDPPCREGTPCFRPGDPTTRGQLAKIVVLAFDFPIDTAAGPTFEDVPSGSTFFRYVETAAQLGLVSGYPCGRLGEPCDPYDRPYYRPGGGVTRGQVAKIVVSAAIVASPDLWTLLNPAENAFEDVPAGSTFFRYVETALAHGVIGGYPCGSAPAGVCMPPENRPYFVPNAGATRAQISKIVYLCLSGPTPR